MFFASIIYLILIFLKLVQLLSTGRKKSYLLWVTYFLSSSTEIHIWKVPARIGTFNQAQGLVYHLPNYSLASSVGCVNKVAVLRECSPRNSLFSDQFRNLQWINQSYHNINCHLKTWKKPIIAFIILKVQFTIVGLHIPPLLYFSNYIQRQEHKKTNIIYVYI